MTSIAAIHNGLNAFDSAARTASSPDDIAAAWSNIFKQSMDAESAKSFSQYYREMRSKTRRGVNKRTRKATRKNMKGGAAPINYQTVPGLPVQTYGRFPVEVDTDPSSIKDLDVYFHDSLPLSKAGYWPTVPAGMGDNTVGAMKGGRRKRSSRRKTLRSRRSQKGGDLLATLNMRSLPFNPTPYPNPVQSAATLWSGATTSIPAPASPVQHTWSPAGLPGQGINPRDVTDISSDFSRLASPAPWQSTQ
jgi:hypothetical protein